MFILKNLIHHRDVKISPLALVYIFLRLSIFLLLLQLRLPCAPEHSLAWGLGFASELQVIDDADEDTVFSPNEDGVQDKLLISFAGDGSLGDYRIIIDVHGAGGIGPPDGKFNPDDDWLIKGVIGSGVSENDPSKTVRQEWDGKDRSPEQDSPPTARTVKDGTYEIRVEIDAFQDGRVDEIFGYTSDTRSATIDTTSPQSSVQVSRREFSPNADGAKDSTQFIFTLSEDVASLQLKFSETDTPAIQLNGRSRGRYTYTWKGDDSFGTPLNDGIYDLQLRGRDNAGNIGIFEVGAVTIDTEPPSISRVTPSDNTFQNTPTSVIEAIVNPDNGSAIDFTSTSTKITLENENGDSIAGRLSSDESENRLTLTLNSPLEGVDENGVYTATTDALDTAGNSVQRIVRFTFDSSPPIVTKFAANGAELKPGATINTPLMFFDAFLADNIALNRNASTIRLSGPKGAVGGVQSPIGENGIRWWLSFPLETDGTDDGTYTLTVAPVDYAANEGSQWQIPFIYDTQAPQLISLLPIEISEPQTFQNAPLSQITAAFDDVNGSGVNLEATTIEMVRHVENGDAVPVAGVLIPDVNNNTIVFRLNQPLQVRDGSQDGVYRVQVSFVDNTGNAQTTDAVLSYDTQAPALVSTTPGDNETVSSLSEVSVRLNDATSGIDFSSTTVRLLQEGNEMGVDASDNGQDTVTLTLAKPLTTDGSDDGEYSIEITPADRAGNIGTARVHRFFLDARIPEIRLNTPSEAQISTLTTIEAQLLGYSGPGIHFSPVVQDGVLRHISTILVIGPDGRVVFPKEITTDAENARLIWTIATPLPRDGSADGEYTVSVRYEDFDGGSFTEDFALTFDTQIPTIANITPGAGDYVSQLNQVLVQFEPDPSGVDLGASQVRLLQPDGTPISSNISDNGLDTIVLQFNPLPRDGTADGIYTIEVTSADRAGNVADAPFRLEFTLATRAPEIDMLAPAEFSTATQVTSVSATLLDYSGEGIDFDHSTIQLQGPNGNSLAGQMRVDKSTSTLTLELGTPLPRNGEADGEYSIGLTVVDKAGNLLDTSRSFIYDTQIPQIVSVTANTESPTPIPAEQLQIINQSLTEIAIRFSDANGEITTVSGVNLVGTEVRLIAPDETQVGVHARDDGVDTMAISFTRLNRSGTYTLEITPRDLAGNVSGYAIPYRFRIELAPPRVDGVAISGHSAPVEFVNALDAITASLVDVSGIGLDLTSDGSTITVVGPSGEVDGIQNTSGTNEIVWTPLQLATDGTMDGSYTATITPVDSAGEVGVPARHQFIFDTQPPAVRLNVVTPSHVIPLDITGDASNISDLLTQVEAIFSDDSAGIDFNRTSIQLLNHVGEAVPGTLHNDSSEMVWWRLDTPLSRKGDADDPYSIRVQAFDKAGNLEDRALTFRYDTQAPYVKSIRAAQIGGTSIDILLQVPTTITSPIQQLTAEYSDGHGSGLDFSRTTVRLVDPNGSEIGGNQTDDGAETVFFSFNPLPADGSADGRYRIQVTPTDLAGNTFTSPIEYPFFYSTQKPEIVSTTPAEFSFAPQLSSVSTTLLDYSGEGIDFDHSTIQLQGPNGNSLAGQMRVDKSTSTLTLELGTPLPRNGEADGEYSIGLTVVDKAGNLLDTSRSFIYDTQIPQIVSVTANTESPTPIPAEQLQIINQSLTEIAIRFSDANGEITTVSGVNLVGTEVRLIAPDETQVGVHARDDGVDTMAISFTRLNRSGTYTLEITPRDLAGNVSGYAIPYRFRIELAPPRVDGVAISGHSAPVEFVNALDAITASLVDVSGIGLDLTSDGSTITVVGPSGEVDGIQNTSGTNEIVWTPLQLATDGTMDGSYTATITPVDSAGEVGVPARHQFIFDTQPPAVSAIAPIDLAESVSYIGEQISQVATLVADVGPAGLIINEQRLHLLDAQQNLIPGDLTDDGTELIIFTLSQPLATDGSDDGAYTVVLVLSDNAGNLSGIAHQVVYDTIPPRVQTHPADGDAISDDIRLITVDLQETGDGGIDFGASTLTLLDANGVEVVGVPNNDGRGRMTLRIPGLVEDGNYTIRVLAVDRAGNGADTPFMARFLFSSSIPAIVSTVPATSPPQKAFSNRPLRQVEAQLQFDDEDSGRSRIALLAPDGTPVAGIQTEAGSKLVYRLSRPLATDGSDDGLYTISVIPVNRAGRQGAPQQFTFVYDTVPPEADPDTVSLIVAEPGANNALSEIQVLVSDDEPSSGIDWDNLAEFWLTLEKIETAQRIRGTLFNDGPQTLSFRLTTPLASDGSQDGQYRVTLIVADRAKNVSKPVMYEFFYDTRPPLVITHSLEINDLPLLYDRSHPDYPAATNSSSGVVIRARLEDITQDGGRGLGVDLSQSTITLRDPDDNPINGSMRQNGIDGIELKSDVLTVEGLYQVTITSVGLDEEHLGFQPSDSISIQFLHEKMEPVAALTDFGGVTLLENEPIPLKGTAHDPETDEVSASGVLLVEIVGVGPDGIPINPVIVQDTSESDEEPWSRWSLDFLPTQSGIYNLDVRVTDRAGNATVIDGVTATFSVSLSFKGSTYVWPNPVRHSIGDTANFSFDINAPDDEVQDVLLSIYDFAGDLVYYEEFQDIRAGRTDQLVTWNLENQSGADVARGVYIFRLEAQRTGTEERTNAVGKILVVE